MATLIKDAEDYLAKYYDSDKEQIKILANADYAVSFFLIWSIFESRFLKKWLGENKEFNFAALVDKPPKLKIRNFNAYLEKVRVLHERYHSNNKYWKNLVNKKYNSVYKNMDIIRKEAFNPEDKENVIRFGLYVVYRYRNNIFHGSKGIRSWLQFEEQIKTCIELMILFLEDSGITFPENDKKNLVGEAGAAE